MEVNGIVLSPDPRLRQECAEIEEIDANIVRLAEQMKRQMLIKAYWDGEMVSVDATPWGAEEAYRLVAKDGTQRNMFLLCRGNTLVSLDMSWEPTAEQMALVGERLLETG